MPLSRAWRRDGCGAMKRDLPLVRLPAGTIAGSGIQAVQATLPALLLAIAGIVVFYLPTLGVMTSTWAHSNTFAHGFFVPPIVLWLVWRVRAHLLALEVRCEWRVVPIFLIAGAVWWVAKLAAVNAAAQFAVVSMLVLTVPALFGIAFTRAILFPLAFLFFCVPFGDFLLPTLMDRTADFTVAALRVSGVPVYREGLQFVVPTGRWSVVEACSGVRYLIASLMVGTLFAYLNYRSAARRIAFVAVSIVVPIIANWIRAYMIVMLGHLTNNRLAAGADHIIYGWVFFGIVMLLMFGIGSRWREDPPIEASVGLHPPLDAAAASPRLWVTAVAILAACAVWPLLAANATARATSAPVTLTMEAIPGWTTLADRSASFTPRFISPSATLHRSVRRNEADVGLFVAFYRDQQFDRKLVSSENKLVASQDPRWSVLDSRPIRLQIGGREFDMQLTELLPRAGGLSLFALQWYWVDGTVTPSDVVAKVATVWSQIKGRGDGSAAVVIYARTASATEATARLQAFVDDAWPAISTALAKPRVD